MRKTKLICERCGKEFKNKAGLLGHKRFKHEIKEDSIGIMEQVKKQLEDLEKQEQFIKQELRFFRKMLKICESELKKRKKR